MNKSNNTCITVGGALMSRKYQVFVSSTYEDLVEERKSVVQALLESSCIPAGMELFPASNEKQWEIIQKVIDDSDYYLLIVAGMYGSTVKQGRKIISYTEKEFDYAVAKKKQILAFVYKDITQLKAANVETTKVAKQRLVKFREKVLNHSTVSFWSNTAELISGVKTSVNSAIINNPASGWIRCEEIGVKNDEPIFKSINNIINEWGLERILKTRAEKNAESDLMLETHNIKQLDGVAFGLRSFRNTRERDVLECIKNGANIRLLVMDPKSEFVEQRAIEERTSSDSIAKSIVGLTEWAEKLNNKSKNGKIQIKYYNAMTIDFYWRVDDCIYIGPYWYGVDSQQTITYKFTVGGRGFNLYSDYFEDLWNNNDLTNRIL